MRRRSDPNMSAARQDTSKSRQRTGAVSWLLPVLFAVALVAFLLAAFGAIPAEIGLIASAVLVLFALGYAVIEGRAARRAGRSVAASAWNTVRAFFRAIFSLPP